MMTQEILRKLEALEKAEEEEAAKTVDNTPDQDAHHMKWLEQIEYHTRVARHASFDVNKEPCKKALLRVVWFALQTLERVE